MCPQVPADQHNSTVLCHLETHGCTFPWPVPVHHRPNIFTTFHLSRASKCLVPLQQPRSLKLQAISSKPVPCVASQPQGSWPLPWPEKKLFLWEPPSSQAAASNFSVGQPALFLPQVVFSPYRVHCGLTLIQDKIALTVSVFFSFYPMDCLALGIWVAPEWQKWFPRLTLPHWTFHFFPNVRRCTSTLFQGVVGLPYFSVRMSNASSQLKVKSMTAMLTIFLLVLHNPPQAQCSSVEMFSGFPYFWIF